eukprot:973154-Amphidinium_carterae.1
MCTPGSWKGAPVIDHRTYTLQLVRLRLMPRGSTKGVSYVWLATQRVSAALEISGSGSRRTPEGIEWFDSKWLSGRSHQACLTHMSQA